MIVCAGAAAMVATCRKTSAAVAGQPGFQFDHASFQLLDPLAGARQQQALDVELLAGDKIEAAQSLRQNIAEVGLEILSGLRQPWRYQRRKSLRDLVDTLNLDHGSTPNSLVDSLRRGGRGRYRPMPPRGVGIFLQSAAGCDGPP
jgi:hypothetical protein